MAIATTTTELTSKRRKHSPPVEPQTKSTKRQRGPAKTPKPDKFRTQSTSNSLPTDSPSSELPSVRDLASSDAATRRKALKSILEHLSIRPATSPLSSTECLQIWRGFFVQVYMHDSKNTLSVQNLLRDFAETFSTIAAKEDEHHEESACTKSAWLEPYHKAFHETLVREWSGIDSHRMNKYLLLIRFVVRELSMLCFRPLFESDCVEANQDGATKNSAKRKKLQVNPEGKALLKVTNIMQVLETVGPLNPTDRKIPDGLRLHLLDIMADEAFGALATLCDVDVDERSSAVLDRMKEPIEKMAQSDSGAQRHVRARAKEALKAFAAKEDEANGAKGASEETGTT